MTLHEKTKPQATGIKAFLKEISKNKIEDIEPPETPRKEFISEDIPRNPILIVVSFLQSLLHRYEDGRVICVKQATVGKGFMKFLLLNPSSHFEHIVKEARAVRIIFIYIFLLIFNNKI